MSGGNNALPQGLAAILLGEDSSRQFKADVHNGDSLASEMAAFANSEGGTIFIGVSDDGNVPGLAREDVSRINQLISNTASDTPQPMNRRGFSFSAHG